MISRQQVSTVAILKLGRPRDVPRLWERGSGEDYSILNAL